MRETDSTKLYRNPNGGQTESLITLFILLNMFIYNIFKVFQWVSIASLAP